MADPNETLVGPVLRMSEEVERIVDAIIEDNPDEDVEVLDRGAYVRVHCHGYMKVTRAAIERNVGRAYPMRLLETMMSSWAGRIHVGTDMIEWRLKGRDAA
ncbi:toluene monooxygenase system protein D [Panacagrimonas perspica]|uniref:Toluene monooxygenase system protein D n=1 Tax=Panacagrimonas perspica TaxID=381431 RepID=A0A4V3F5P3_9GAMM|nr:MmoB/DmpM family protein [Panacagrimonas perspica]TDU28876.1 toluene monooxygenase system protein D [Panacagrimonas perspica]THD02297.1 hypothetical protein B1810_15325 [Panacagrimonas perspica]